MKKLVSITLFLVMGLFIGESFGAEVTLFGPNQYLRTTGKPNLYTDTFPGIDGQGKLILKNGDTNGNDRVSSALITINGKQILGPNNFSKKVSNIQFPINLSEDNSISVELRSNPGSYLTIQIIEEINPVRFIPGTNTNITSRTIGASGGIIQIANSGTPLDGITVEFPAGAISDNVSVSLGYNNGTLIPNSGTFSGKVISLSVPGVYEFDQPVTITAPLVADSNVTPVPYYVDPKGNLRPVQLVEVDIQAGTFKFQTFHSSWFTWIFGGTVYAPGPNDIVDTGYIPRNDGFQIGNKGSIYNRQGECFGMTSFSLWYFLDKKTSMGNFYPKYFDVIAYDIVGRPLTGQDIIATRAFTSITQYWNTYYFDVVKTQLNFSDADRYASILNIIANTRSPVLIYLFHTSGEGGAHSVLAYAFNRLDGNISIYDPNCPADDLICLALGIGQTIHYNSSTGSFDSYSGFDGIVLEADGELRLKEPYQNILDDAEANFQRSGNAIINITSHTSGQEITTPTVNLAGTIESGEVLVTKLRVFVGSITFSADVGLDGRFNIPLNLTSGINYIHFQTLGPGCIDALCGLGPVSNNMLTDFILNYVPAPPNQSPTAGIAVTAQGQTVYENGTLNLSVAQGGAVTVSFSASRSSDPDGSIASYEWRINGQPADTNRDFIRSFLAGTYDIFLEVWDNLGAKGAVGATVTVSTQIPNQPPNAGFAISAQGQTTYENQILNLTVSQGQTLDVSFSASRSSDPDGSITSYQWYINGTPVSTARDFNFGLGVGTHQIFLEVWDNSGDKGAVGATIVISEVGPPPTSAT